VIRVGTCERTSFVEAADRTAAIRAEAHRDARAALADHWLSPRQVQLLLLALAEVVQASADDAASCAAEDAWIAAVSGLEEAASSIDHPVEAEREAPPRSFLDVRAAEF
jgi:hypothetical protein